MADSAGQSGRTVERAARNEATFREANKQLDQRAHELGVEAERFPFLCECEQERCTELIMANANEYSAARSSPRRFLIVDGHDPDSKVVERFDGFVVVEKEGREGELVEELDS